MESPGFPPSWFFKEPANFGEKYFSPWIRAPTKGRWILLSLAIKAGPFLKNITTRWRVMDGSFLRLTGYFLMAEAVYVFLNHCPRYLSSQLRSYLNRSLFFFSFSPVLSFRPKLLHPGFPPSRAFWGFLSVLFFPQEEAWMGKKLFN